MKPDEECDVVTVQLLIPRFGRSPTQVRYSVTDLLQERLSCIFNIVSVETIGTGSDWP